MKKKTDKRNMKSLKDLWGNIKSNNISIIGVPERHEYESGVENIFGEIMAENAPKLVKEKGTEVQEVQRVPIKMNPKRPTPKNIVIKMSKLENKENILRQQQRESQYIQESPH